MTHRHGVMFNSEALQALAYSPGLHAPPSELASSVRRLTALIGDGHEQLILNERWHAAQMDLYVMAMAVSPNVSPQKQRQSVRYAYRALVRLGQIQPSAQLALLVRSSSATFTPESIEADSELQAVLKAVLDRKMVRSTKAIRANMRALAAIKTHFGKNLTEITSVEWRELSEVRDLMMTESWNVPVQSDRFPRLGPFTEAWLHPLGSPYEWACAAGAIRTTSSEMDVTRATQKSLTALRRPQWSLSGVMKSGGFGIPPTVRRVVENALSITGLGLDRSTIRTHIYATNAFFLAVREVLPACDSLQIPYEAVRDIVDRIGRVYRGGQVRERLGIGEVLSAVRGVYEKVAVAYREVPEAFKGLESANPGTRFPVLDRDIQVFVQHARLERHSRLKHRVEAIVSDLDSLTESANRMLVEGDKFVNAARVATPGDEFAIGPFVWVRAMSDAPQGAGNPPMPLVRPAASRGRYSRADDAGLDMVRSAALWLMSRYTGMRTEELAEATLDNLSTTPGLAGAQAPTLIIPPSKSDREHEVVLERAVMDVLDTLVGTIRRRFGEFPSSPRFDPHEQTFQPPRRLLFFRNDRTTTRGPALATFGTWIGKVVQWQERELGHPISDSLHPQMMRRVRATELNEAGVNIYAVQRNLGHAHATMTEIYTYPNEDKNAADLLGALERKRAASVD